MEIQTTTSEIQTVEDALEHADIDLDYWEVVNATINSWEVGAKIDGKIIKTPLWQVKVKLKRKVSKLVELTSQNILKRIANEKPVEVKPPKKTHKKNLLEVSLFDVHFGKLAWERETGNKYDLKIAERIYAQAVSDLLNKIENFPVSKILFPIGQDFFHVDNWSNTTNKGTEQDVDDRFQKVFESGCMAVINAINECLEYAPVDIVWVPGNHDVETSWYLIKYLEAWFRQNKSVKVDSNPTFRKYYRYGNTLIGYTHGCEEKHQDLPLIMANEVPDLWSKTKYRTMHIGHVHKKKVTNYVSHDSFNGVDIVVLPSLSAIDSWHYKKGYVGTNRAAECYLYNYSSGYVGHFSTNVR